MTSHEERLIGFLAGDLDVAAAGRFDEHLLGCEACWRAVREDRWARAAVEGLREPAPTGLTDRVRMAIELYPEHPGRPRRRHRVVVGLTSVAALAVAGVAGWFLPGTRSDQAAFATVVRFAELVPAPTQARTAPSDAGGPIALGAPITLAFGGRRVQLSYYRVDGSEVVVATSKGMFPMPEGGRPVPGTGNLAWETRRGRLGIFCANGSRSVLAAGAMPLGELRGLVTELHLL